MSPGINTLKLVILLVVIGLWMLLLIHLFNYEDKPEPKDPNACDHGKDYWCKNCIAKPQLTSVELPDGTISTGYILTNLNLNP